MLVARQRPVTHALFDASAPSATPMGGALSLWDGAPAYAESSRVITIRRFFRSGCGTTSNFTTCGCGGGGGGGLRTGDAPLRRRTRRGCPTGMSNCRTTTARDASASVVEDRRIRVGFGRASFFCCCASRSPAAARTAARRSETKVWLRRSNAARKLSISSGDYPIELYTSRAPRVFALFDWYFSDYYGSD